MIREAYEIIRDFVIIALFSATLLGAAALIIVAKEGIQ